MCYYLQIASPLTLSEVRSMLPPGIAADALAPVELAALRTVLPGVQTAAHLKVGPCSCDLVRPRQENPREDERHLRSRYARLGLTRDRIIQELERHRRAPLPAAPRGGWRAAFVEFVAEHARNAGPTVYHLAFHPGGRGTADVPPRTCTVAELRASPESWLQEGQRTIVVR